MYKLFVLAAVALLSVGCASKGSVEALSSRVDALEANEKTQAADIAQLKSDHEAIKGEHADLTAKMDRMFAKKNLK